MTDPVKPDDAASRLFAAWDPRLQNTTAPPPGLRIRPIDASDIDDVAQLIQQRDGGSVGRHREQLARQLAIGESRYHILGSFLEGTPAGFGRCSFFEPPAHSPPNVAPAGWYLAGLIVQPAHRRLGIGTPLTQARLSWLAPRTDVVYCFASARNPVTIDLHAKLRFTEVTRDFSFPGAHFTGGVGILFQASLGD